jgi:hypothetical protein
MAAQVLESERCYAVGSPGNSIPWTIRSGEVQDLRVMPEALLELHETSSPERTSFLIERPHVRAVITSCEIVPGFSGGPLLNSAGQLIGITYATPRRLSIQVPEYEGVTGYHVHIDHLRQILDSRPTAPDLQPPDLLNLGLTQLNSRKRRIVTTADGLAIESIEFHGEGVGRHNTNVTATASFFDFHRRASPRLDLTNHRTFVPAGLWGCPCKGLFLYDLVVLRHDDGSLMIGYCDQPGTISEARVGNEGSGYADHVFRRSPTAGWVVRRPPSAVPLFESPTP